MKIALIIGLGGFLGSISRYLVNAALVRLVATPFPIGTFTINILGSLMLGIIVSLAEYHKLLSNEWRFFLAVGFCGSFTTFSTFALEGIVMMQQKQWMLLTIYTLVSLVVGFLTVALGYYLTNRIV